MRYLLIITLGVILFSSCEKETYVDYYIDNQSSNSISVNGTDIIHSTSISHSINSREKKDVSGWSKRGKQTDFFEPITMFGNDLVITNSSGDTLTKDYKSVSNWTSDIDNKRATASHEYVLIIKDSDF